MLDITLVLHSSNLRAFSVLLVLLCANSTCRLCTWVNHAFHRSVNGSRSKRNWDTMRPRCFILKLCQLLYSRFGIDHLTTEINRIASLCFTCFSMWTLWLDFDSTLPTKFWGFHRLCLDLLRRCREIPGEAPSVRTHDPHSTKKRSEVAKCSWDAV